MSHLGDRDLGCKRSPKEGSQLFILHFGESDFMKQYIVSLPHSPQQKPLSFATLEETCDLYLQQRFVFLTL